MFAFIYTLGIYLAQGGARLVALFHPKTRLWVKGQAQTWSLIEESENGERKTENGKRKTPTENQKTATTNHKPRITNHQYTFWFHAASLGEFEQGRPVIEACRRQYPAARIVLTFFSPSGYENKKDYDQADVVCYLPADTPAHVARFLDAVQPDMALFIKYEFWPNYLFALKKRGIPALMFSAIFRPDQLFFKAYGGFYRNVLCCLDHILVQNRESEKLLKSIDYNQVTLAGDTRLDRVVQIAKQAKTFPLIEQFKGNTPLLIVGSAWPDDLEVIFAFLHHFKHPLRVIVAPHEINAEQIKHWRQAVSVESFVYSEWLEERKTENGRFSLPDFGTSSLLFLDTVGMLSSVYRYADFVFVGGGYRDGLHNTMEPAVFGMPIFFGQPYYRKFQEALDLLQLGGAQTVANADEFSKAFTEVYENELLRKKKADICREYVQKNAGATEKVMEVIKRTFIMR
ncbi:3-deoxy-D-manno-octulosonic acid transferase [Runella slithyformis]|uniref:3-deoxy-D-manno-octulosonic acid transferase n=1 Tax=Runella slithyformis (strain ATCC 29530 / DSM 19594 / LMG 11500 / NCIMB 11436 / LSU 4) TaxID=761193 RepID=A0A7U3ZLB4_RUNSL|nr:glycosyltransferase N-terminal domain-containing protein [Runella slithyformis]AEI49281.1 Three-deoxy-D-manno-octulosonic-acid transferase domain-containing protein [Runella slithyformis DSM 19594]